MLTSLGYEEPRPCKVHECGESYINAERYLCTKHYAEKVETNSISNA